MIDFSQPGLAVFDMDSTLITIECIDEIADRAQCKPQVAAITAAAMRGEIDFAASLRQRVALLRGVKEQRLAEIFSPLPLTPGAAELMAWLRQRGWRTALVSGGFTWFAEQLQQFLQLDHALANRLEIRNGELTGEVIAPIIDAEAKALHLRQLAAQWHIPLHNTIAVGDGANDIAMVQAAGFGVAFCAKPALQHYAQLVINEPDLSAIARHFEAQGSSWQK
ncbi:phosphoserine phosphatase SerB [Pseudidiomarina mangrovi]|uniref:phosphoserine phosphatase SerB n=1 Tax=Pseudidiomarina mangrovi TaxID=2487133 RepID=UPI000FCB9434|nr:phosphoserine phosphatase SerB [Pseudidiomarina mangrovi]